MGRKFWIRPKKTLSTIVMAIAFHIHKLHDTSKRYICLCKETLGLKFGEVRDAYILTLGENMPSLLEIIVTPTHLKHRQVVFPVNFIGRRVEPATLL